MRYGPGSFTPGELERLQRERLERERIEQLMHLGNALLGGAPQHPTGPDNAGILDMPQMTPMPNRTGSPWDRVPAAKPMPYLPFPNEPIDPWEAIKPMPYRPLYPDAVIDPRDAIRLLGLRGSQNFETNDAGSVGVFGRLTEHGTDSDAGLTSAFPFRQDNRNPDGTWTAPDANRDNIRGTSVDPAGPVWPRWKQTPPHHGEGEFVSQEPFFDIDEITQKAEFYPPGRPLVDFNVDGNPASRQRGSDLDAGNSWRRRLLVQGENPPQMDGKWPGADTGLIPIGPTPVPAQQMRPSSSSPASASSTFAGFIPGRARPGDAQSAVEPLNPELRERKRKEAIVAGGGGSFSVAPNPNANPNAPWYEYLARSSVKDYADQIEQVAKEEGIDPDLIRAAMFVETTHGQYGIFGPLGDALGTSKSILPMNMNVQYWGDNFGTRAELDQPLNNIRAGARMLKNIIGNFQSPASIATIGTLYNDSNATRVSDYGARVESVYKTRPWERELDLVDTQVPLGLLPDR